MIGNNLRKIRSRSGLKQSELARDMGLSQQTISLYESNKRNPDLEMLIKLAKYFEISTDCLLGIRPAPKHVKPRFELSCLEIEIINYLRLLTRDDKEYLIALMKGLTAPSTNSV